MPHNKVHPIPHLSKEILRHVLPSDNPFVSDVNKMIELLNALSGSLPPQYGWRYRTADAMKAEMAEVTATATDFFPLNALYWRDQLGNWEAYSLMNTLRVIDLARGCVWALAREDALCATLLARSALETAASFVDTARTVSVTISEPSKEHKPRPILDPATDLRKIVLVNLELEQ